MPAAISGHQRLHDPCFRHLHLHAREGKGDSSAGHLDPGQSTRLHLSSGAVRTTLCRARQRLRAEYVALGGEPAAA